MQATEQQVQMAAKLYEMRDRARILLGEKYKPHMAELGGILKDTARQTGKPEIAVATEIAKKRNLIGVDLMMVLAPTARGAQQPKRNCTWKTSTARLRATAN